MYKCPLEKFPDGYVDPVAGEAVVSFDFIKRGFDSFMDSYGDLTDLVIGYELCHIENIGGVGIKIFVNVADKLVRFEVIPNPRIKHGLLPIGAFSQSGPDSRPVDFPPLKSTSLDDLNE